MKISLLFCLCAALFCLSLAHEEDSTCVAGESLNFASKEGRLWLNDKPFTLKGLNWFGFETTANVIFGLQYRPYREIITFIKENGFNFIRMPFYLELMLNDAVPDPSHLNFTFNPELKNKTSLEIMDIIIAGCKEQGILIMPDMHSFVPGSYMEDNLWYNAAHPESMVLQTWDVVINRFHKKHWNLVAIDLKNEPHGVTWGTGNIATDFDLAAQRLGNHILANGGEKILIFVTGSHSSPPCACFWGENFMNIREHPVVLSNPEKLVFTPHTYGPNVFDGHPYFSDPTFPDNMIPIWEEHFGFVPNATGRAIVIGEWGGRFEGKQQLWNLKFAEWLKKTQHAHAFWCLNPESADTGGLFEADWKTPIAAKLNLLREVTPNPTMLNVNMDGKVCIN